MKLANNKILTLVNLGLLQTTEHDVPAEDAYKSYKFRKAIEKAFRDLADKDKELPKTAGVEEGKDPTEAQAKKIIELRQALYNDETELEGNIIPMSWAGFHALSNENKRTAVQVPTGEKNDDGSPKTVTQFVDVFRACEGLLDGVLFKGDD